MLSFLAFGSTRKAVPQGGSVAIPAPYDRKPSYPTHGERLTEPVLFAYRNWRSTMSGHPECDGMIAVGRADKFANLKDFMASARGGLSTQWSYADTVPGTMFTKNEQRYPVEPREGEWGAELVQVLAVHRSGWLDVYDDPALMYVVAHRCGAHIGVWITNRHGGPRRALKLAARIAASFEP